MNNLSSLPKSIAKFLSKFSHNHTRFLHSLSTWLCGFINRLDAPSPERMKEIISRFINGFYKLRQRNWLSALPLLGWCLLIFVLSSVPRDRYPSVNWSYADKLVHVALYFVLGLFAWLYFQPRHVSLPVMFAFGVLFGASDEIHQIWVPLRTSSLADLLADTCGVGLGLTCVTLARYYNAYLRNNPGSDTPISVERMGIS